MNRRIPTSWTVVLCAWTLASLIGTGVATAADEGSIRGTVTDPQGAVLVHLGSQNFVERFKVYVAHVQEWRAQFHKLESVDLRYEHQVIVNPENAGVVAQNAEPNPPATGVASATPATEAKASRKTAAAKKSRRHK